ncbi:hypothetical protein F5B22DRAFT_607021 [Xylaria bambusicola]|uniref:uncharacterized protein n=1 Tax=Xylaria bambusicola TaxID=326684 RepID=UPI0020086766|nr:uncharacterized protein F5B22DRAFT_607021 [Xylaria bambusicola]KAI0515368.1 hypothetical protein F5B22DRAFT_607021 [Xylaria bambusicola]
MFTVHAMDIHSPSSANALLTLTFICLALSTRFASCFCTLRFRVSMTWGTMSASAANWESTSPRTSTAGKTDVACATVHAFTRSGGVINNGGSARCR